MYELSKRALKKGHEVMIYLNEDGTIALNSNIKSPGERNIANRLEELVETGAQITGCGLCGKFRGVDNKSLVEGTKFSGMAVLSSMIENCDKIIIFSF